jgi:energy-coupling factor transporter ATP-binding protein EcfA2
VLTFSKLGEGVTSELQLPGLSRVYKYLRDRGIEKDDIEKLGIKFEPASTLTGRKDSRCAIIFPHRTLTGETADWWSARMVELEAAPKIITSFAQLTAPKGKMYCPPKEPPMGYLPPILRWGEYERGDKIYIHESAIKAINGAKLGKWSVGLNGVWGWRSDKHGIALVRELKDIPWKQLALQPIIVFDSNAADNAQVQGAISALAAKLFDICGVRARHILLPKRDDGEHWGFDDFVVARGREAALAYLDGEGEEVGITDLELMKLKLNAEVCIVRSLGRIAEQETGTLMSRGTFVDVNYADYVVYDEEGKQTKVAASWLADTRRTEVETIVYEPGKPRLTDGNLNLWSGMGREPAEGDVGRWLELFENNIADEELRKWLLQWMAYPLQNPGAKMNQCVLVFGPSGTGKDVLFRPLSRIYGSNYVMISNAELKSDFTSLYTTRQFVHANELVKARSEGEIVQQRIKMLVTSEHLTVNTKGQPEYKIRNVLNLALTSNYVDCVRLDADDRRVAVVEWKPRVDHRRDEGYWIPLVEWIDGEGSAAIYDYLLKVDLTGFNPMGWAPESAAKEEVKEAGVSSLEAWARRLVQNPDEELPPLSGGKALWSARELAAIYYENRSPDEISKRMVDDVAFAIRALGLEKANSGKPIKTSDGRTDRYWVLRQREADWSNPTVCSNHLKMKVR